MDLTPFILIFAAGLSLGALVALYLLRARIERPFHAEAQRRAAAEERASRIPDLERLVTSLQSENSALRSEHAALHEKHRAFEEKFTLINQAQANLTDTFRALSADALHTNNRTFLSIAEETLKRFQESARGDLDGRQRAIQELVKPLQDSLQQVGARIHDIEMARGEAYSALTEQVKSMAAAQGQLQSETARLVQALRAPHTRGRWGELQLKRAVEIAGMVEYCDFREQQTFDTGDGRIRPDMIVHLPNRRRIVVDSKASLAAYLDALEATDESTRIARLRDHAAQVRAHVTRLANKSYWAQFDSAPEFVVAFLPGETFFSAALEHDPGLIEFGADRRVIIATPTTLIALLKAVSYGWRQERVAQNAEEISRLGRVIYERLSKLAAHFAALGQNLDRTVRTYNEAVGTLESRVLPSARSIKEKGVTVAEDIPSLAPLDRSPRSLQAPELLAPPLGNAS